MTLRTDAGCEMRKCITPGCPVHVYPGPVCSDCKCATVSLRMWRERKDRREKYRPSYEPNPT